MLKAVVIITLVNSVLTAPSGVNFSPINEFSFNLLQNVFAYQENFGPQNLAVSPVSVWNIFSLLSGGASGATFAELSQLLRLPKDVRVTQDLHLASNSVLKVKNKDVILNKQAAMFAERELQIHPEFCESASKYNTEIYTVDASNTTKLANDINYFICMATEGAIKDAVKPDLLENLRLLLVDAMYFKANWTTPFDSRQTKRETFYDQQGRSIGDVNMMYQKAPNKIVYAAELEADVLELTYGEDKEFAMVIFLPDYGVPLKRVLNNLSTKPTDAWTMLLQNEEQMSSVECQVPRFKISSQLDLIQPLKYMGLYSIFDEMKAELPGISDSPLYVSKTIQKTELEVTEEGTVAAVATVVGLENRILGPSINVNKPFVYAIVNRRHNIVLFTGVYTNPSVV
ncbi:unnamed protein product [Plutella xylostella]|uniref:(diamondback moth) hypothetical protein n=1 Tax=Plutella xylostella TaxID=51655 RepID=A0A8S4F1Z2_PLUXY|nr:serpin B8 [Plutella xylostella]CAG9122390.1 unnamed protein product [Plutella xylostella]